ncbi:hypothetical protein YC2023_022464 [Brassica napus]
MIHFHSFASISSPSALSSCPSNLTLECLINKNKRPLEPLQNFLCRADPDVLEAPSSF